MKDIYDIKYRYKDLNYSLFGWIVNWGQVFDKCMIIEDICSFAKGMAIFLQTAV